MMRCSATGTNSSYRFQCSQSLGVTCQAVIGFFSRALNRFFWAFFPRCSQNLRTVAPATARVRSNAMIRDRAVLNSSWSISSLTRWIKGSEYQAFKKIPMVPAAGRSRQKRQKGGLSSSSVVGTS